MHKFFFFIVKQKVVITGAIVKDSLVLIRYHLGPSDMLCSFSILSESFFYSEAE